MGVYHTILFSFVCLKFSLMKNFQRAMRIIFNEALQRNPETSYDLAVWRQKMDSLCLLIDSPKQLAVLQLGVPSNPVRQKHPTPALSSRTKIHLNISIIGVQSWEGPWHS